MIKLLGALTVNGKTYSKDDSIGKVSIGQYGLDNSFYGGRVKSFLKTKDGYLLCLDKRDEIINMAVDSDNEPIDVEDFETISGTWTASNRKELLLRAKELGIPGKIATLKSDDLINLIREYGGGD